MQKGASRRLSRTKIAFTCIPRGDAKTQASASLPVTHTRAWTHTHTYIYTLKNTHALSLSFMPDYNRIILTRSMHFQTYRITWERRTVQKIPIMSACIPSAFVPASARIYVSVFVSMCVCVHWGLRVCVCRNMHVHLGACVLCE